ncbi:hypothetical protein [uncultured Draconibacterium sp.]|uniref:hypothetical protein n=1 Tax=uncultured Draconibacterium sp. TaxID=1573823 RepID=UPI0029C6574C|nr:hypothetical protein [uncultured Draconibacterium sp.]
MLTHYILLAVFGVAMAHLEGVVVVYLQKAIGLLDTDSEAGNKELLEQVPKRTIKIEMTREAATIVMLITLALVVGSSWLDRIMVFLWTFAFWDLFYYVSLYVLLKWPPKLTTTDVLFLIPVPWIAPVWFPVGISTLTIVLIAVFYLLPGL